MADTKAALDEAQREHDAAAKEFSRASEAANFAESHLQKVRHRLEIVRQQHVAATAPPVDRSKIVLTDGSPVPPDRSHTELTDSGMQKGYIVLSDAERAKGFVRPVRESYRHTTCGKITTMGRAQAETYARDPHFYNGTFCSTCRTHFPVGEDGEFTWYENDGTEGPKVGT
jgi:exonuclease VII small subunit